MLVEMRIYTFTPGSLRTFLPVYEREILPIQKRHLGRLIGWYVTESGKLNTTVQMWGFDSAADRDSRREALWGDEAFKEFGRRYFHLIQSQESIILKPTSFSP